MGNLTIWDLLLTPFYLVILIALAKRFRDRHYPIGHPLRQYFLKGLLAKFCGAIFVGLVFEYYYPGGDTYNFFNHSQVINSSLSESFSVWLKLMLHKPVSDDPKLYTYISQLYWYKDSSSYTVARIGALLGLLNGTSYIPISLLFSFIAYTGIWSMFTTFVKLYPNLHRHLAVAFLFIPSTLVWGSAFFKDTICMFGLGWMTYTVFRILMNRDLSLKNIFMMIFSFVLIAQIKLYILIGFIPALNIWLLLTYSKKISNIGVRWLLNLGFVALTIGGFFFFTSKFAEEMNRYSLKNIATTAQTTKDWTAYAAAQDDGSVYDLGVTDGSVGSLLSKFPQAVVVTLFRPFPWEARKVIVLLSALEAFLFMYFTLKAFLNLKTKPFRLMLKDPNLIFFLTFSLIFSFAVGISSGNFGALSRYKIPCLPFYAAMLAILLNKQKVEKEMLWKTAEEKTTNEKAAQLAM